MSLNDTKCLKSTSFIIVLLFFKYILTLEMGMAMQYAHPPTQVFPLVLPY